MRRDGEAVKTKWRKLDGGGWTVDGMTCLYADAVPGKWLIYYRGLIIKCVTAPSLSAAKLAAPRIVRKWLRDQIAALDEAFGKDEHHGK